MQFELSIYLQTLHVIYRTDRSAVEDIRHQLTAYKACCICYMWTRWLVWSL